MNNIRTAKYLLLSLSVIISLLIILPAASGNPAGSVTINYVEALNSADQSSNQVGIYVTISGDDENPVSGLPVQGFKILEDGRPVENIQVSQTNEPVAVVLVIDTSGSMLAKDKSGMTSIDAVKNAAVNFMSLLNKNDRIAIFSFNKEPVLEMDFSEDHAAAVNTINSLKAVPNASTCLYDTAYESVKKAAEIPKGRRAIILLTDGKDEKAGQPCSTYSANDVIDAASTKTIRVPVYTIGAGKEVDVRELGRISKLTGGRNLIADSNADFTPFYKTIASQLKNQYAIRYNTQAASGEHSLVVKIQHENLLCQDEKSFWAPPVSALKQPFQSSGSKAEDGGRFPYITAIIIVFLALITGVCGIVLIKRKKVPRKPGDEKSVCVEEKKESFKRIQPEISKDEGEETVFMEEDSEPKSSPFPTAILKVVQSQALKPGTTFELCGCVTVGRTNVNDIDIPDKSISRKHGEIYFQGDSYYIRDLGSRQGIKVDEIKVTGSGSVLNDEARIKLGPKTILEFSCKGLKKVSDPESKTKIYNS
ncbi:MAG: VWA domain-containing protein [Desulfobacterales bacterium]|nr:VWA domain-containing protein [Desulfobacterales bacterium]